MRWLEYARKHGRDALSGLPGVALRRVAEAIDAGRDVVEVAREECVRPDGGLPPSVLLRLFEIEERRLRWKGAAGGTAAARESDGLPPLGEALVAEMGTPDSVFALDRAARLAPSATAIDLREIAGAWDACFAMARKEGVVKVAASGRAAAEPDALVRCPGALGRPGSPEGLSPQRWLAIRCGEREGAVEVSMEFPVVAMRQWMESAFGRFGLATPEWSPGTLAEKLVLCELPAAVRRYLDERSEREVLVAAGAAYAALFRIPPVLAERVAAAFFVRGPRPVGWAVVGADGTLIESGTDAASDDGWAEALVERLRAAGAGALVLPTTSPATERLPAIAQAAQGRLPVARMPTTGIQESKSSLEGDQTKLPAGPASALVLALRALDPASSFAAVDPASLCEVECRSELDPDRVGRYLLAARALAEIEAERAAAARPVSAASRPGSQDAAGAAATGGQGPSAPGVPGDPGSPPVALPVMTVSSIDEIRPGMWLAGVVASLTPFGAFVNMGLRQDGLVHLSELADHHVADAAEVVRPGQQVRVRVVAVDRTRNRISLSLRAESARMPRSDGPGGRVRSAAMRELDKYFKK